MLPIANTTNLPLLAAFFRRGDGGIGQNDQRQLAFFRGDAEFAEADERRELGQAFAIVDDVGVLRGRLIVAFFRDRQQGLRACRTRIRRQYDET